MMIGIFFEMQAAEYTVRVSRYAGHGHMPAHAHDHDGISVVIDDALAEEAEHRAVTATSGWAVTKPRGVLHKNRFGELGATILAVIPSRGASSLPRRWQWMESPATFQAALRLARPRPAQSHADTDDRVVELIAPLVLRGSRDVIAVLVALRARLHAHVRPGIQPDTGGHSRAIVSRRRRVDCLRRPRQAGSCQKSAE